MVIPDVKTGNWSNPPGVAYHFFEPLLNALVIGMVCTLRSILVESVYLSSARTIPPRDFSAVTPIDPRRWPAGLAAWDLLMTETPDFVAQVNEWLTEVGRFNSGCRIDIQTIKEVAVTSRIASGIAEGLEKQAADAIREDFLGLPTYRKLRALDLRSGVAIDPRDLGYGLSELLPVIVAALHHESGVVAIEEPESNVHPTFQVVLADLLITRAKANPGVLFLIETHSEHLMLRCLRRIRETAKGLLPEGIPSVSPDDIAVHFVEATKEGPKIEPKEIDEDGDFIDEWSGGFFEESFHEKFAGR